MRYTFLFVFGLFLSPLTLLFCPGYIQGCIYGCASSTMFIEKNTWSFIKRFVFAHEFCLILKIKFIRCLKNRDTIFKAKHTTPNITDCFDATPPKSGSRYLPKDYMDVYSHKFETVP